MCKYWYGIGVVTMRSADFNASSTVWQSRNASKHARVAEVPRASVVLDDGRDLRNAHVRAVPRFQKFKLLELVAVFHDVRHPRLASAVARHELLVRDGADVAVPVPLSSHRLPEERVEQVRESEQLHAIFRHLRRRERRVRGVAHRRRRRRRRHRSQKRRRGDVQVSQPAVHAPEILFALVVPLVREVRAEDEEKRQHDGHAEVPVQVKRHVALRVVRDVFPALTNFHDVRDQPDERGGDDLRDHPRDDRVL